MNHEAKHIDDWFGASLEIWFMFLQMKCLGLKMTMLKEMA